MKTLNPILHEAAASLRFIGMRDRLRCPRCKAVGTYKPHGYWWAQRKGDRQVRRWLCKYCGLYYGPEGQQEAKADPVSHVWELVQWTPTENAATPQQIIKESRIPRVWPWFG